MLQDLKTRTRKLQEVGTGRGSTCLTHSKRRPRARGTRPSKAGVRPWVMLAQGLVGAGSDSLWTPPPPSE